MSQIVFRDRRYPIQVFCPQKYRNYYIRGQIDEVSDNVYNETFPDGYCYAYYQFTTYYLVRATASKNIPDIADFLEFPDCRNRAEFLISRRKYYYDLAKHMPLDNNASEEENLNRYLQHENEPIEVNLSDINIVESPFLQKAIEHKKDLIFLKKSVRLDRLESPTNGTLVNYPKHIYTLPAYHLTESSGRYEADVAADLDFSAGMINEDFYFNLKDVHDYSALFCEVGDLAWKWIETQRLSGADIKQLGSLYEKLKVKSDPYKEFYFNFLDDLISDLINNKVIGQCSFCGQFFRYSLSKKYCSLQSDGKDCGKKIRNKRFYQKNKARILPKAKLATQEQRQFLREKGVKK